MKHSYQGLESAASGVEIGQRVHVSLFHELKRLLVRRPQRGRREREPHGHRQGGEQLQLLGLVVQDLRLRFAGAKLGLKYVLKLYTSTYPKACHKHLLPFRLFIKLIIFPW